MTKEKNVDIVDVEKLKKEHGEIYSCEFDGGLRCYLKRPTRQAIAAASAVSGGDKIKYYEVILNNCWILGDEIIKTDIGYFLSLFTQIDKMIGAKECELKKL